MKYWICILIMSMLAIGMAYGQNNNQAKPIHVLVWSENNELEKIYPAGLAQEIADYLNQQPNIAATTANLDDPDQGLNINELKNIDVVIWAGNEAHDQVADDISASVAAEVKKRGMGFVALHAAHISKPFQMLLNTSAQWKDQIKKPQSETMYIADSHHPIAKGVSNFFIPHATQNVEPINLPKPDSIIVEGVWPSDEISRDVMTWTVGKGRLVYIATGDENYPIFHLPEMQKILTNAVIWAAKRS